MNLNRGTAEELNTGIEPIKLTDDELRAVAGGGSITLNTNSLNTNTTSFNNSFNF